MHHIVIFTFFNIPCNFVSVTISFLLLKLNILYPFISYIFVYNTLIKYQNLYYEKI